MRRIPEGSFLPQALRGASELLQQAGYRGPGRILSTPTSTRHRSAPRHPRSLAKRLSRAKAEKAHAIILEEGAERALLHPGRRYGGLGGGGASFSQGPSRNRRGVQLPAPAVGPLAPRPYRTVHGHARGKAAPERRRDAGALQRAVREGTGKLSRLRRMARARAGGYAIQGSCGHVCVSSSAPNSNFVGLPLYENGEPFGPGDGSR